MITASEARQIVKDKTPKPEEIPEVKEILAMADKAVQEALENEHTPPIARVSARIMTPFVQPLEDLNQTWFQEHVRYWHLACDCLKELGYEADLRPGKSRWFMDIRWGDWRAAGTWAPGKT